MLKLLFSFSLFTISFFNLHLPLYVFTLFTIFCTYVFFFLSLIINIFREIRQKEIYKLIIDTNPLYINKFFRTVSKFRCVSVNLLITSLLLLILYVLRKNLTPTKFEYQKKHSFIYSLHLIYAVPSFSRLTLHLTSLTEWISWDWSLGKFRSGFLLFAVIRSFHRMQICWMKFMSAIIIRRLG